MFPFFTCLVIALILLLLCAYELHKGRGLTFWSLVYALSGIGSIYFGLYLGGVL